MNNEEIRKREERINYFIDTILSKYEMDDISKLPDISEKVAELGIDHILDLEQSFIESQNQVNGFASDLQSIMKRTLSAIGSALKDSEITSEINKLEKSIGVFDYVKEAEQKRNNTKEEINTILFNRSLTAEEKQQQSRDLLVKYNGTDRSDVINASSLNQKTLQEFQENLFKPSLVNSIFTSMKTINNLVESKTFSDEQLKTVTDNFTEIADIIFAYREKIINVRQREKEFKAELTEYGLKVKAQEALNKTVSVDPMELYLSAIYGSPEIKPEIKEENMSPNLNAEVDSSPVAIAPEEKEDINDNIASDLSAVYENLKDKLDSKLNNHSTSSKVKEVDIDSLDTPKSELLTYNGADFPEKGLINGKTYELEETREINGIPHYIFKELASPIAVSVFQRKVEVDNYYFNEDNGRKTTVKYNGYGTDLNPGESYEVDHISVSNGKQKIHIKDIEKPFDSIFFEDRNVEKDGGLSLFKTGKAKDKVLYNGLADSYPILNGISNPLKHNTEYEIKKVYHNNGRPLYELEGLDGQFGSQWFHVIDLNMVNEKANKKVLECINNDGFSNLVIGNTYEIIESYVIGGQKYLELQGIEDLIPANKFKSIELKSPKIDNEIDYSKFVKGTEIICKGNQGFENLKLNESYTIKNKYSFNQRLYVELEGFDRPVPIEFFDLKKLEIEKTSKQTIKVKDGDKLICKDNSGFFLLEVGKAYTIMGGYKENGVSFVKVKIDEKLISVPTSKFTVQQQIVANEEIDNSLPETDNIPVKSENSEIENTPKHLIELRDGEELICIDNKGYPQLIVGQSYKLLGSRLGDNENYYDIEKGIMRLTVPTSKFTIKQKNTNEEIDDIPVKSENPEIENTPKQLIKLRDEEEMICIDNKGYPQLIVGQPYHVLSSRLGNNEIYFEIELENKILNVPTSRFTIKQKNTSKEINNNISGIDEALSNLPVSEVISKLKKVIAIKPAGIKQKISKVKNTALIITGLGIAVKGAASGNLAIPAAVAIIGAIWGAGKIVKYTQKKLVSFALVKIKEVWDSKHHKEQEETNKKFLEQQKAEEDKDFFDFLEQYGLPSLDGANVDDILSGQYTEADLSTPPDVTPDTNLSRSV